MIHENMLNLTQNTKQQLKISSKQIQWLNFLQYSTLELHTKIEEVLTENPLLELEENPNSEFEHELSNSSSLSENSNFKDWDEIDEENSSNYNFTETNSGISIESLQLRQDTSLLDEVLEQIYHLSISHKQAEICRYIIHSLDEHGFLPYELEDLADDISFAQNTFVKESEINDAIILIQQLEPQGLASKNPASYLFFQLKNDFSPLAENSRIIITQYFQEFANKQFDKIMRELALSEEELQAIQKLILSLNVHPLHTKLLASSSQEYVVPDYIIIQGMNQLEASLNSRSLPKIKINEPVVTNLQQQFTKNASSFIQQKITQAQWLIQAIEQRERTMQKVIKTIIRLQKDYFQSGDIQLLKPMILKDVAHIIDMDIATISRVTSGKYAQTPFGLIHLKDLFSEATQKEDGNWVSNKSIQHVIRDIVTCENPKSPLNDSQITDILKERGFPTARRTVAKYREQLGILPAQLRKVL